MSSTYTTNKGLENPANGDYVDTWNVPVNGNSNTIDACFGGATSLNVVSVSGTVVLSEAQYRPPNIVAAGTLTAAINYQVPSGKGGRWSFYNNTSGAFTITLSSGGGGRTVTALQGYRTDVICDGTNVDLASTAPNGAAGSNTNVQYNSSGIFAGSNEFNFDGTNVAIGTTPQASSKLSVKGAFRLYGSSSGYVGLRGASAAGSTTYTLPAADGSSGQFLTTDGSGALSWSGVTSGVVTFSAGTTGLTPSTATSGAVTLGGTLNIANGGTGQTTASGAINALLPSQSGNNGRALTTDGSLASWGVFVSSVNASGGTTGLSFTGGPVTSTGTLTLSGTLGISNGGTGQTTASGAINALLPTQSGNSGKYLTTNGSTASWDLPAQGSVTSVAASGGTTGLNFSGSPITSSGTLTLNGTLIAANGGTGQTSYTTGDILYASASSTLSKLADVATGNVLLSGGVGVAPTYGKVGLATHVSGTLPVGNGGTNLTSYTTGDLLYASGASTLASLADVGTGNALISGGVGVAPSYGKVGLTTHVSGTLPIANGGTNSTSVAQARQNLVPSGSMAYVNSGTSTNSGKISWGTSAPGTLDLGEIYLRYS